MKTVPTTVNYTYDDSTWKDLLTNFNGTSISYDSIGNPANWRDGMTFTWSGGREFGSVTANGTRLGSCAYDSDGVSLQHLRDEIGRVVGLLSRLQTTIIS